MSNDYKQLFLLMLVTLGALAFFSQTVSADACSRITSSTTLTSNSNTTNTACFSIENSNLTFDCAGFSIFYENTTAINVTNSVNVTIRNCFIYDNRSNADSINSIGINLSNVSNSKITNVTIQTNGTANSRGIVLNSVSANGVTQRNNIVNNTINASGTGNTQSAITFISNQVDIATNITNNTLRVSGVTTGRAIDNSALVFGIKTQGNFMFVAGTTNLIGYNFLRASEFIGNTLIVVGTTGISGIQINAGTNSNISDNNISIYGTTNPIGLQTGNNVQPNVNISRNNILVNASAATVPKGISLNFRSGPGVTFIIGNNITVLGGLGGFAIQSGVAGANFTAINNFFRAGSGIFASTFPQINASFMNNTIESPNGSITFPSNVSTKSIYNFSLQTYNISSNVVRFNSTNLSEFNVPSIVSLRGLSFTNAQALIDLTDLNSYSVCSASSCTEISYLGNTFIFNVSGWTSYSSQEEVIPLTPLTIPLLVNVTDPKGSPTNYTLEARLNTSYYINIGALRSDCRDLQLQYNGANIPWTVGYSWNRTSCNTDGTVLTPITFFTQSNLTDGQSLSTLYQFIVNDSSAPLMTDILNYSQSEVFYENHSDNHYSTIASCGGTSATAITFAVGQVQNVRKPPVATAPQGGVIVLAPVVKFNSSYTAYTNMTGVTTDEGAPTSVWHYSATPKHEWDSTCDGSVSSPNGSLFDAGRNWQYASFGYPTVTKQAIRNPAGTAFTQSPTQLNSFKAERISRGPTNVTYFVNGTLLFTTTTSGGFGFNFTQNENYFRSFIFGASLDGQAQQDDGKLREAALAGTPQHVVSVNWVNDSSPGGPANTCTYVSGDWTINVEDLCIINTNTAVYPNKIIVNGTLGYVFFNNTITMKKLVFAPSALDGGAKIILSNNSQVIIQP